MNRPKAKPRPKDPTVYPPGWNYRRAQALARYYDARKDEDVLGESIDAKPKTDTVWVEVPPALLPKIRKLIAQHRKTV
jgi:hypothetical protein